MRRVVVSAVVVITGVWCMSELTPWTGWMEGAAAQTRPNPNEAAYRFEEVADGVHFAIGTGAMTVMSNALVIVQ